MAGATVSAVATPNTDPTDTGPVGTNPPDSHRTPPGPTAALAQAAAPDGADAGLLRAFGTGSVAGFFAVGALGAALSLYAGMDVVPALGVAAFAGFWGGPGFGGTLGAVSHLHRHEPH